MSSIRFVAHCAFELARGGLIKHDIGSDGSINTTMDARAIALVHNEMEHIMHESSSQDILRESNQLRSKWRYSAVIYFLLLIPLNIFCLFYSATHNDTIWFIVGIVALIFTLFVIYQMEYYFMWSVYSFLSWHSQSISLLRDYADNIFNKTNQYSQQELKCGLSYDMKSGLYQLIAHHMEDGTADDDDDDRKEFTLYYRFNEDYIAPIMCQSFDVHEIERKGIGYYHEWSRFMAQFLVLFNSFDEDETVQKCRVNKIRQSTLKQIRRMFIVFGLLLVIGVPLIMNDDNASFAIVHLSSWVLVEGVLFLTLSLFAMPSCCRLYHNIYKFICKNKRKQDEELDATMMNTDTPSSLWTDCMIREMDQFCHYLSSQSQYINKYTFSNETGFFDTPNNEHYTGKISICSKLQMAYSN